MYIFCVGFYRWILSEAIFTQSMNFTPWIFPCYPALKEVGIQQLQTLYANRQWHTRLGECSPWAEHIHSYSVSRSTISNQLLKCLSAENITCTTEMISCWKCVSPPVSLFCNNCLVNGVWVLSRWSKSKAFPVAVQVQICIPFRHLLKVVRTFTNLE